MHTITVILVMLFAVIISTYIARLAPFRIPLPLFQIALGALLSWAGFQVVFDSHLFLLLFIPPLLFLDGWRIPKGAIIRDWPVILSLAIGLVVFTVVGMGFFIHWLIPAIPLAITFALAAILSPTDPVAVSAISASAPIPSRLMHILEGEALFNDATGLVCFSFAVAAAMTGAFSIGDASVKFLFVAGGGVIIGIAVSWVVGLLNSLLIKRVGEDSGIQILISILIPFAAYLGAEHIGVSGILAAAVAGIASHYYELSGRLSAATRMQRRAVWDTIQITLNGIIFILLGEQLPGLIRNIDEITAANNIHSEYAILVYITAITIGLGALRFVWVGVSLSLAAIGSRSEAKSSDAKSIDVKSSANKPKISIKSLLIIATAGVRGAITLAGILTLPLLMLDGSAFPGRDLAILIAMGVILLSLIIASIALPLLTKDIDPSMPLQEKKNSKSAARIATTETAIKFLEAQLAKTAGDPLPDAIRIEAINKTLEIYRRRLAYGDTSRETTEERERQIAEENRIYILALQAERDELYRLRRNRSLGDEEHSELVREIDLLETSLTTR
jgi:Na+/H+ antiporter